MFSTGRQECLTSSSQPWSLVKSPRKNLKDTDPSIPNPEMLDLLGVA